MVGGLSSHGGFIYRGFDAQRPQMRGGICSPENSFKTVSCGPIWPAGRPSADGRAKKVSKNPGIRGDSGGYESLQIRVSGLDPEPLAAGFLELPRETPDQVRGGGVWGC